MALAVIKSRALSGVDAPEVIVEVHLGNGLPSFSIVGLPEAEVKESKDRVRAAIQVSRFEFPAKRITVNLAPADLPKESGRYDLPIALGILAASGQISKDQLERFEVVGELALTGEIRLVQGSLAMAAAIAKESNPDTIFMLPADNAAEASLIGRVNVLPARSLLEACAYLTARQEFTFYQSKIDHQTVIYPDFNEVKGQSLPKRALEIAAAGGHSVLMAGPPGTGKSMLAARLPGILTAMTDEEALESASIQSLNGKYKVEQWGKRPFRAPHHTASAVALVGGGGVPRPGEISLAHHGVLFLDELPEFDRKVLEVLREPMESGRITISRAARQADFPADFQLIAAMNPCPCGYLGHYNNRCRCTPDQVARYRGKISGPLLDRIDLHIEVPALHEDELISTAKGESSADIRKRVEHARQKQVNRQGKANYLLTTKEIDEFCYVDDAALALLKQSIQKLNLSARAYHRILKVARTIADLADEDVIQLRHVAEAIQYRRNEIA